MTLARRTRLAVAALVAAVAAARSPAGAQPLLVHVTCPGFPDAECSSLRFDFQGGPIALGSLSLSLDPSTTARWAPVVVGGSVGAFEAEDAAGPFAGATTIDTDGRRVGIDFAATGAPFTLAAGTVGLLRLALDGELFLSTPIDYTVVTEGGETRAGRVVPVVAAPFPEPGTLALVAAGLAGCAAVTRRRAPRRPRPAPHAATRATRPSPAPALPPARTS